MNTERRMDQTRGLWHYILHFEFKMLRSSEYNSFRIFDALTIISEPDSDAIPHQKNGDIHIIPTGWISTISSRENVNANTMWCSAAICSMNPMCGPPATLPRR